MADQNSTESTPERTLKPFQWHRPEIENVPGVLLAGNALDLALGINCVLEILQKNGLEKEYGTEPLSLNQEGRLMGLVIAASRALADDAERYLNWARESGHAACNRVARAHPVDAN